MDEGSPMTQPHDIGESVRVRTASGEWLDAVTTSRPEGAHVGGRKVHDFPVVWVRVMGVDQPMPWPLADAEVSR